jgi:hypothetical protein
MTTGSNDSNEEITAGNRPLSVSNEEWNQQTIVDARNVIQTQQSVEPSRQFNEQRSSKLKIYVVFFMNKFDTCILVNKQSSYPNHVLHPEVIPSLNNVHDELKNRRHIRFNDPSLQGLETFEADMPIEIASSLQDELQRAVQHRFEKK